MIITTVVSLSLLQASGCGWPEPGRGGMAEFYMKSHKKSLPLTCAYERLQQLRKSEEIRFQPANFHAAATLWNRAARAEAGKFSTEARSDLSKLRRVFDQIELSRKKRDRKEHKKSWDASKMQECGT